MPAETLPDDIAVALERTAPVWRSRLRWYAAVGSTSDVAARLAESGVDEWAIVAADEQTTGRGRHGRSWASRPGAGLYFSIVLRPAAHAVPLLTLAAGVAVADGIEAATGLAVDLKWPNDVMAGARKLGGILAEAATRSVVLGIGINVHPAAYPPEIALRATSLEAELGRQVDRGAVLIACLEALERRYRELDERQDVLVAWRRRAARLMRRRVTFETVTGAASGLAYDVDETGALLVKTETGVAKVISGEVTWS